MSEPYLGEIKLTSFGFAPNGWALCNGQSLPINQNQALFAVLGVQYGGDGITSFALPNLQGRMPIHQGRGFIAGNAGGEAAHTLTINEMPAHNHPPVAATSANSPSPSGTVWAPSGQQMYSTAADIDMASSAVASVGGDQPHENRAPYLVLNFIIALQGVYPSRN